MLGFGVYNIAVILISIMLSVAGIILGFGYVVDDRKLKEFGKSEIYQCIINGIIVGSLIAALSTNGILSLIINNTLGTVSISSTCEQSMSSNYAICFAYNYLVGIQPITINGSSYPTLLDTSISVLAPVSALYTGLSILSSIKLGIGIISIGFASALNPVLTALNYVIEALTGSIVAIEVQGVLLKFISVVAIPVLLPVGIVLRTFYFTRRLGGAIMAIAIGLYAVFPLTYVLNAQLASTYVNSINSSSISSLIVNLSASNSNIISRATQIGPIADNQTNGLLGYFSGAINNLVQVFDSFINALTDFIALLIIEVFFIPVFSLILTAISIRELARIFGAEISFGRLYIF